MQLKGGQVSDLWTEALLLIHDPAVSNESLTALQESALAGSGLTYPQPQSETFDAMEALNHFIIGYSTASGEIFGGASIRSFKTMDFFDHLRWNITLLGPRDAPITDQEARAMFDLEPGTEVRVGGSITGDLHDLPAETLAKIPKAIDLHQDFVFYEFAFEAKMKMLAGDSIGALLMAVSALEGAHSAYVQAVLASKLPENSDYRLPGEFLRLLGMALCNKLTPYIFMEPTDRPDGALISEVADAIELRNGIAHALRNKRGVYRVRAATNQELNTAYSATLKLYNFYCSAFERLSLSKGTSSLRG
jgi:hypothetical protein